MAALSSARSEVGRRSLRLTIWARLADLSIRHARTTLVVVGLITLFFAAFLLQIRIDTSFLSFVRPETHTLVDTIEEDFGADWAEEVRVVLESLPAEQREAFLLRHVEDLSYEDIAAVTGAGLSALRMRVKRACDALRIRLTEVQQNER